MEEKRLYWYNYETQEYVYRDAPQNDDDAVKYLPQSPAVYGLYRCHRAMGASVLDAMIKTLTSCVGGQE